MKFAVVYNASRRKASRSREAAYFPPVASRSGYQWIANLHHHCWPMSEMDQSRTMSAPLPLFPHSGSIADVAALRIRADAVEKSLFWLTNEIF